MDLQASKIELAKMILEIENQKIIDKIIALIKMEKDDFWNDLSELEKKSIRLGMKQLDNGEGIPLDEFIKSVS